MCEGLRPAHNPTMPDFSGLRLAKENMFPALYHAHHAQHPEDLPFWEGLASRQEGPLLELGCGTGRVLLHLAQAGFQAWGLDSSAEMLRFLRAQPDAQPGAAQARVFQADLAAYHLDLRFGLILLPCNTLSTLPPETRRAAFACARRHLRPDGLFAASLPNPTLLRRLARRSQPEYEESFAHPLDGEPVQVSSGWERSGSEFTVSWHYDHLLPDGRVERLTAQARHQLTPLTVYRQELLEAGLEVVEQFGDFDRGPHSASAPHWIFTARPA